MATILTAEEVVRRIAAECAYVDERGGVGIRLEPATAIVRQYGEQFRPRRREPPPDRETASPALSDRRRPGFFLRLTFAAGGKWMRTIGPARRSQQNCEPVCARRHVDASSMALL
jgi:hypothetical protein